MMTKKHLAAGVLMLLVGFSAGYASRSRSASSETASTAELQSLQDEQRKFQKLKGELSALSAHDFEEYVRLKDLERKYKKADELIGKMILIFLADLGLRVSDEQARFAQVSASGDRPSESASPPTHSASGESLREGRLQAQAPNLPQTAVQPGKSTWVQAESKLADLRDEKEIEEFLKATRIQDLSSELKKTTLIKKPDPRIEGCFEGAARVITEPPKTWQMKTNVVFDPDRGSEGESANVSGKTSVEISENGRIFSNSRGSGPVKDFRNFTQDSSALLLKAGQRLYFQLYYLQEQDAYAGNVYELGDSAEFKFHGTVRLYRSKNCR